MRLFPTETEISDDEGFDGFNDIFARKEFGERLTALVKGLEGPAVIVLDAPWGSGKTTFVKMWRGHLKKKGVASAYFDAFKNDYQEDAFLALASQMLALADDAALRDAPVRKAFKDMALGTGKVILRGGAKAAARLAVGAAAEGLGEELKNALDPAVSDALQDFDKHLDVRLEGARKDEEAFTGFGQKLHDLATALGEQAANAVGPNDRHPLVFVVDELDRCKPPFALAILESIKHFYNVENVIFVLVTNLEQLAASVQHTYGTTNPGSYLEKFYHLRMSLPETGIGHLDARAVYAEHLASQFLNDVPSDVGVNIAEFVSATCAAHGLGLRTMERVIALAALAYLLPEGVRMPIPSIVAGLAFLKITDPQAYTRVRQSEVPRDKAVMLFQFSRWRIGWRRIEAGWHKHLWHAALGIRLNEDEQRQIHRQLPQGWRYTTEGLLEALQNEAIPHACSCIDGLELPL